MWQRLTSDDGSIVSEQKSGFHDEHAGVSDRKTGPHELVALPSVLRQIRDHMWLSPPLVAARISQWAFGPEN